MKNIRRVRGLAALLRRIVQEEVESRLALRSIRKPEVINFLVTDVCNSRCEMCNIWKNALTAEMTVDEFRTFLRDPLFTEVAHVGITGGEPTLRPDLPRFYEAACEELPKLRGMSLITNGLAPDAGYKRIMASRDVCSRLGKSFSTMISIDGLGSVHDRVRGRSGNFSKAISLLNRLRSSGVPVSIACTITKTNCMHLDELLDWATEQGVYVRFRVGEYIDRLGNADLKTIRNFDSDEVYNVLLFFSRLIRSYEDDPTILNTYRNIVAMLSEGAPRRIGCPYQSRGVVLSARAELLYCAPKSPVIESMRNLAGKTGWDVFKGNSVIRDGILNDKCASCIHDYHVPVSTLEHTRERLSRTLRERKYSLARLNRLSFERGI